MNGIQIEKHNIVMTAGENPDTNDIGASICYEPNGEYLMTIVKFKLDPEEIEKIREIGAVYVGTMGAGMAPTLPMVHSPFDQYGFVPLTNKEVSNVMAAKQLNRPGIYVQEPNGSHRMGLVYTEDLNNLKNGDKLPIHLVNENQELTGDKLMGSPSKWHVRGFKD